MAGAFNGYIREAELAQHLEMSVSGLRSWRRRGYGPVAIKIGRRVAYSRAVVLDWLAERDEGGC
jgi:predicted DNA-binding transcriptional regulator AlpA